MSDYRSWSFTIPGGTTLERKTLFKSKKKNRELSQWTIIVQYQYGNGTPSPAPPNELTTAGVSMCIFGTANGISEINNVLLSSQSWIPVTGIIERAFGEEISVVLNNDNAQPLTVLISALEDSAFLFDGDNLLADSAVQIVRPQFAQQFMLLVDCASGMRQLDVLGNSINSIPVVAGRWYPLHPLCYQLLDSTPQAQVYAFKKGRT